MMTALGALNSAISAYNTLNTITTAISNIGPILNVIGIADKFFNSGNGKASCVTYTLFGTGIFAGAVCVLGYYAPQQHIDIPFWALGVFAGTISVITCIGACCLKYNLHEKHEEAKRIESQLSNLATNAKNLKQQTDQLNGVVGQLRPLNDEFQYITERLNNVTGRFENATNRVAPIMNKQSADVEREGQLIVQMEDVAQMIEAVPPSQPPSSSSSSPPTNRDNSNRFLAHTANY